MKKIDIIFLNGIIFSVLLFDTTLRSQIVISLLYLIYLFMNKKLVIKRRILIFFISIVIISVVNILKNEYTFFKMLQQVPLVFFMILSYYNFFLNYDLEIIWNKYIKICQFFALVGILQVLIYYFFSFNIGNFILNFLGYYSKNNYCVLNNFLMCSSLSGEPGMYAQVIMPATFFCIENTIKNKKIKLADFILIISYFLTFVTIAYFGVIVYCLIKLLIFIINKEQKKLYLTFFSSVILCYIFIKYFNLGMIKQKFYETFLTLFNILKVDLHNINLSTFALISNLRACILSRNYYFGNGVGTMEQVYYRFFKNSNYYAYGLNATDGYSLAIRLTTECGLLGLCILILIILKYTYLKKENFIYNTINFCSIIGISSYLVRGGSYFMQGTIIFYMFLIFSKKELSKGDQL